MAALKIPCLLVLALGIAACEDRSNTTQPPPEPAGETTITGGTQETGRTTTTPESPPAGVSQDTSQGTPGQVSVASGEVNLGDAQIVATADAAIDAALDQAREDIKSGKSAQAKQLAQKVVSELDAQRTKLHELEKKIGVAESPSTTSERLKTEGALAAQNMKTSASLDDLFIGTRVSEGSQFIGMIDHELMPQAQDKGLRDYLRDLRAAFTSEDEHAKKVQEKMTNK